MWCNRVLWWWVLLFTVITELTGGVQFWLTLVVPICMSVVWGLHIYTVILVISNIWCTRGDPKILGIVKKKLFKIVIQVWNFSSIESTRPVIACSNPSAVKIFVRNAVKGHQRFLLNLCIVSRTPLFQILIHPWETKKLQVVRSGEQGNGTQPPVWF